MNGVPRIGQGWDRHRLVPGRPLVLGGVAVPSDLGEDGHSDGDALLHAIVDAVLGACALGDIGTHFPPSDPRWKDAPSRLFLERAVALAREAGWAIGNLDATVVLESPRLGPHMAAMRASIAEIAGLSVDRVSVKAKTGERVDATGRREAVEAQAAVLMVPVPGRPVSLVSPPGMG